MRPLDQQVVVITGASSGIGRCTALHLADRGARLAVFARGADALSSLVDEIRRRGGDAVAATGDVASADDIDRLAETALERYGRIDTWVNNAAVFIQGRVRDVTPEEYRRVLEVNLLGTIQGSRRALLAMEPQGEGVIIQVASIVGERGPADFSAYAASKRGIAGFSSSLRTELWDTDIEVSTLFLPAMDTPIYQHARSKFGTSPKPAPPVYDPIRAAEAIAGLAVEPEPEKHIGWFHWLYTAPDRISPRLGDWFLHRARGFSTSARPTGPDNLDRHSPVLGDAIRGGWGGKGWRGFTVREMVDVLPAGSALAATAAGFALGFAGARVAGSLRRGFDGDRTQ